MADKKALWNHAGKAGLVLGGISLLYMVCDLLLAKVDPGNQLAVVLAGFMSLLLWAAKFCACIFLMRHFMKSFVNANGDATNADSFRFGHATALLSALIYAGGYMAYVMYVDTSVFDKSLELMAENPMLTSDMMDMMEQMIPKMPAMTFFANLIYCWMFGTVLSAILSRNIPSRNPFQNNTTNDQ